MSHEDLSLAQDSPELLAALSRRLGPVFGRDELLTAAIHTGGGVMVAAVDLSQDGRLMGRQLWLTREEDWLLGFYDFAADESDEGACVALPLPYPAADDPAAVAEAVARILERLRVTDLDSPLPDRREGICPRHRRALHMNGDCDDCEREAAAPARCSEHPAFEADYCPGCGTETKITPRPADRPIAEAEAESLAAARAWRLRNYAGGGGHDWTCSCGAFPFDSPASIARHAAQWHPERDFAAIADGYGVLNLTVRIANQSAGEWVAYDCDGAELGRFGGGWDDVRGDAETDPLLNADAVADNAAAAFWAAVADAYPEVVTGDRDPAAEYADTVRMRESVRAWLVDNHPYWRGREIN